MPAGPRTALLAAGELEGLDVNTGQQRTRPTAGLLLLLGASPHADRLPEQVAVDDHASY